MIGHLTARSISRPIADTLRRRPFVAHLLAAFEQACDLVTPNGDVIAIVTALIGDGPLNILVDAGAAGTLGTVERDAQAELAGDTLQVGGLKIALESALSWEPCPDWSALRARLDTIRTNLPSLRAIALSHAPEDSLLAARDAVDYVILSEAKNLESGWKGDVARLQEAAAHLAGRGIGLTPAGDDLLAGLMLWAWLAHLNPEPLCHTLAEVAVPHTTTLSAAFLRSAARGECDASWHRLLAVLSSDSAAQLAPAIQRVMAHGATSGADMLAGFMWLAGP